MFKVTIDWDYNINDGNNRCCKNEFTFDTLELALSFHDKVIILIQNIMRRKYGDIIKYVKDEFMFIQSPEDSSDNEMYQIFIKEE